MIRSKKVKVNNNQRNSSLFKNKILKKSRIMKDAQNYYHKLKRMMKKLNKKN
jgi:hypothetical protein